MSTLDIDKEETVTAANTSIQLVRHKEGNISSYFVTVNCVVGEFEGKPDERLLLLRHKDEPATAGGTSHESANDRQISISQLLIQRLMDKKGLTAAFQRNNDKTELIIDIPDSVYYLRPVQLVDKHMTSITFFNDQHALAYAGDIIDALLNNKTDWTKMTVSDNILTV